MLCDNCKADKLVSDFINSKNICYKCLYRIKLEKMSKTKPEKPQYCRTCGTKILHDKETKKRQRTIFCCSECAKEGHQKQLNNHWTRKIPAATSCPKKGAIKWTSSQKST